LTCAASYSRDVESGAIPNDHSRAMKSFTIAVLLLLRGAFAVAQPCPKVNTTTQTPATMRAIVKSVNCLVASGEVASPVALRTVDVHTGEVRTAAQVDTLPIIGPQHSRIYPGFMLAILSMPVDNNRKSAIVTPDSPQADLRGAGGGECKLKLNSDRTLDAQCNQAGGTVFVVFK
jgi:hypothetical protein